MDILDLLDSNGYIKVNKKLIQEIGLEPAVILGEIISKFKYHKNRGQLKRGGWFYFTVDKMEEVTSLSKYKQKKALKTLKEYGFIEQEVMGVPSKRYFKPNKSTLLEFFASLDESGSPSSSQESGQQGGKESDTYNAYKNKNKKDSYKEKESGDMDKNHDATDALMSDWNT